MKSHLFALRRVRQGSQRREPRQGVGEVRNLDPAVIARLGYTIREVRFGIDHCDDSGEYPIDLSREASEFLNSGYSEPRMAEMLEKFDILARSANSIPNDRVFQILYAGFIEPERAISWELK